MAAATSRGGTMAEVWKSVKQSGRKPYSPAMAPRDSGDKARQEKAGITDRGVKKTIWFHEDEAEALRQKAFKERRSESAIVREAVRRLMGIED
jgi:hypothetical protein